MVHLLLLLAALQQTQLPIDEFRSIQAFQCNPMGGGGHNFEPIRPEENEEPLAMSAPLYIDRNLTFDSIDYRALRARSVSPNQEPVTVAVIPGDRLVSFLEVSPKGVPILTTILRSPRPLYPRSPNAYFFIRSYQLLRSEQGYHSEQINGFCGALPTTGVPPKL